MSRVTDELGRVRASQDGGREASNWVHPQFLDRWSPRALLPEPIPADHVESLLEAVRWAPSCFNEQPWVVVWATRDDREAHARLVECLAESNRRWAAVAPLLAVLGARTRFARNGKDNRWADFDAGSAWLSLALQAEALGYRAHAMGGFDVERAHELLGFPRGEVRPLAAIAVGRQGPVESLPEELRERERPSDRRAVDSFAFRGRHPR
ncbi:MAG: nitroreductase family protein [Planctomycetes bacterium]|nr:nitroreductase family protein [Planctomycetota bacterium]